MDGQRTSVESASEVWCRSPHAASLVHWKLARPLAPVPRWFGAGIDRLLSDITLPAAPVLQCGYSGWSLLLVQRRNHERRCVQDVRPVARCVRVVAQSGYEALRIRRFS